ncbi:hypothetical protein CC1G_07220 [Coprinopsis cinerea okayama7|uniref:Uncharacterized protein n=1 Tax=Coprinopsis cinerea (strain Okayama-7 / 130 / ATCC MYA-4618 / FGSC 9003) TaxID=240176 RepID=A8PCZ1_COPC7|nr:hypothetical protein CC1G_07220 [Coprinopsis cinerea okayama7\|eukprot:XP_001840490.2 hypothetical protein CC1G_07220 [Coprinopsis cinerea okayama7\
MTPDRRPTRSAMREMGVVLEPTALELPTKRRAKPKKPAPVATVSTSADIASPDVSTQPLTPAASVMPQHTSSAQMIDMYLGGDPEGLVEALNQAVTISPPSTPSALPGATPGPTGAPPDDNDPFNVNPFINPIDNEDDAMQVDVPTPPAPAVPLAPKSFPPLAGKLPPPHPLVKPVVPLGAIVEPLTRLDPLLQPLLQPLFQPSPSPSTTLSQTAHSSVAEGSPGTPTPSSRLSSTASSGSLSTPAPQAPQSSTRGDSSKSTSAPRKGRPTEESRARVLELFESSLAAFAEIGVKHGHTPKEMGLAFQKWIKDGSITIPVVEGQDKRLVADFNVFKDCFEQCALETGNTVENLISRYHSEYLATPRKPNPYNQFRSLIKFQGENREKPVTVSPDVANENYRKSKKAGTLERKLGIWETLSAIDGPNQTLQAREKYFENFTAIADKTVAEGEKHNLESMFITVGTSIHQDQGIVHIAVTPTLEGTCWCCSKDELTGLMRLYVCNNNKSTGSLKGVVRTNVRENIIALAKAEGSSLSAKTSISARQSSSVGSAASSAAAKTVHSSLKSDLKPPTSTPQSSSVGSHPSSAAAKPVRSSVNPATKGVTAHQPTPLVRQVKFDVMPNTIVIKNPRNTAGSYDFMRDVFTAVQNYLGCPPSANVMWKQLPSKLGEAGWCLRNYPAPGFLGLPGEEEKGGKNGQGLKGVPAAQRNIFMERVQMPGGNLILERGDPVEMKANRQPVIITAAPLLTPAEKVAVEASKLRVTEMDPFTWPLARGRRQFADLSVDWDGLHAIVRESTIVEIEDSDDESPAAPNPTPSSAPVPTPVHTTPAPPSTTTAPTAPLPAPTQISESTVLPNEHARIQQRANTPALQPAPASGSLAPTHVPTVVPTPAPTLAPPQTPTPEPVSAPPVTQIAHSTVAAPASVPAAMSPFGNHKRSGSVGFEGSDAKKVRMTPTLAPTPLPPPLQNSLSMQSFASTPAAPVGFLPHQGNPAWHWPAPNTHATPGVAPGPIPPAPIAPQASAPLPTPASTDNVVTPSAASSNPAWHWPAPNTHATPGVAPGPIPPAPIAPQASAPLPTPASTDNVVTPSAASNASINPVALGFLQHLLLQQQSSQGGGLPTGYLTPGVEQPSLIQAASNMGLDPNLLLLNMFHQQNQHFGGGFGPGAGGSGAGPSS